MKLLMGNTQNKVIPKRRRLFRKLKSSKGLSKRSENESLSNTLSRDRGKGHHKRSIPQLRYRPVIRISKRK